jgi:hypothetical protein
MTKFRLAFAAAAVIASASAAHAGTFDPNSQTDFATHFGDLNLSCKTTYGDRAIYKISIRPAQDEVLWTDPKHGVQMANGLEAVINYGPAQRDAYGDPIPHSSELYLQIVRWHGGIVNFADSDSPTGISATAGEMLVPQMGPGLRARFANCINDASAASLDASQVDPAAAKARKADDYRWAHGSDEAAPAAPATASPAPESTGATILRWWQGSDAAQPTEDEAKKAADLKAAQAKAAASNQSNDEIDRLFNAPTIFDK